MFRSTLILTAGSVALSLLAKRAHAESANAQVSLNQPSVQLSGLPEGRPTKNYFELGLLGGLLFPSKDHELQDRNHQPFDSPVPELGMRAGFYPLAYLGVEAEGTAGPTKTAGTKTESGKAAGLWGVRFQAILQLPAEHLTPFLVLGAGGLGAGSTATGTDVDPALHFGAGAKWSLDDFVAARLDVRDNMSQKNAATANTPAHHPEVQLSLTFTLDLRQQPVVPMPAPDADKDGKEEPPHRI